MLDDEAAEPEAAEAREGYVLMKLCILVSLSTIIHWVLRCWPVEAVCQHVVPPALNPAHGSKQD